MTWQFFVGISILLFSLNGLLHRILMKEESSDPFAQTIAFYGLGGIFALGIAIVNGGFKYHISLAQIPSFLLLAFFATAAPVLLFKAYKHLGASEVSILLSSHRLWAVLGAFLFLRESFSVLKIFGTLIILCGITVAQWRKQKFVFNNAIIFVILASLCYAISEIVSFYILRDFDAPSFSVYASFIPVIALFIIRPQSLKKLNFYFKRKRALNISAVALMDTLATLAFSIAYQVGRNASQISPIMATQTIITVFLAIILLKERDNLWNKLIGAAIVVLGIIFIV